MKKTILILTVLALIAGCGKQQSLSDGFDLTKTSVLKTLTIPLLIEKGKPEEEIVMDFLDNYNEIINEFYNVLNSSEYEKNSELILKFMDSGGDMEDKKAAARILSFKNELEAGGINLEYNSSAGEIYFGRNTDFIKSVTLGNVNPVSAEYINLLCNEIDNTDIHDGFMYMEPSEMANRAYQWGELSKKTVDLAYKDKVESMFIGYLEYLFFGSEVDDPYGRNTYPEGPETGKFTGIRIKAMNEIIEKYPTSRAAAKFKPFLELLKKNNFEDAEEVRGYSLVLNSVEIIDETRFVLLFPSIEENGTDEEDGGTDDIGWYASLTREVYEKLGIEVISFNQSDGALSFALDDGKYEIVNMKEHSGLLYKKGKKPISVGWLEGSGYDDYMEPHWKTVAEYLQIDKNKIIKLLRGIEEGEIKDKRDGQIYRTVKIGGQLWMAQNLNYAAQGSKCYGDDPANCEKYGRLYDWETAKTACPAGWRLPTIEEWTALTDYANDGEEYKQGGGDALKSTSGWNMDNRGNDGSGKDKYGFTALPGGKYSGEIGFNGAGEVGEWWSASEKGSGDPVYWGIICRNIDAYWEETDDKTKMLSVRCVKE